MPSDFFDELGAADNFETEAQAASNNNKGAFASNEDEYDASEGFQNAFDDAINARMDAQAGNSRDNSNTNPVKTENSLLLGKFRSSEELAKAYQNLERQHTQSRQELARLEKAKPIIDAITQDDGLYQLIDDYFQSPDSERQRRALGLPEDFQMDMDEAVTNPDSPSGRVLAKLVESQAAKIIEQREQSARTKENLSRQADQLKAKYNLTDEQITELVAESRTIPLTLEDVYLVRNKENLIGAARAKGAQDVMAAQKKAKGITPSGARAGTSAARGKAFIDELLDFDNNNSFKF